MTDKTEAEIEAELKSAAIERAKAAGAKFFPGWSAEKIEHAASAAEEANKQLEAAEAAKGAPAPPTPPAAPAAPPEDPEVRKQVIAEADALGMDLEDLRGRPLAEILSMVGKASAETAGERAGEREQILAEAAKLGIVIDDEMRKKATNDQILERIGVVMSEKARMLKRSEKTPQGRATVRVLPKGDGKISKGIHVPGVGDLRYVKGDTFSVPLARAKALEEQGYVEIQNG